MHVLILGPTGRTGRLVVNEALKRGRVRWNSQNAQTAKRGDPAGIAKRQPSDYQREEMSADFFDSTDPKLLDVHEGTPLNKYTLSEAMKGCDAILSTLNISRTSDFPWASLRTSQDFLSLSMKNILQAAAEQSVKRIIITTAWGVGETRKDLSFWFRWLIDHSNMRYTYEDHTKAEEMLKKSDMDYTSVQPVKLTDSPGKKPIEVSLNNDPKPRRTISRKNVARFILDELEDNLYQRQCPVISEQ